jgi:hypothetical protein
VKKIKKTTTRKKKFQVFMSKIKNNNSKNIERAVCISNQRLETKKFVSEPSKNKYLFFKFDLSISKHIYFLLNKYLSFINIVRFCHLAEKRRAVINK